MANYINLSLQGWQKYAHDVCLAIDQKTKQQAEHFFFSFVQSPQMQLIIDLIQRGSDLLVFALFSYMGKHPQPFVHQCNSFFMLMQLVSTWQLQEFNFIRPGHKPFQLFVTKTIMLTLGTFMKWLYEKETTSRELIGQLQKMPLNYLKIYILKTFIETVEIVDSQMGYMRFRSMIYSFQDNIIPMICDTLIPFFHNFEDSIRVSDLTVNIEAKLDVSEENSVPRQSELLFISKEQEMESEYVLALLKKIVQFNYNITYTEYQSEQVIDTCLITFPERVAQKIINSDFLSSLFYVISKVMESKIGTKKNEYLTIVLECVAKLMQARLGYVTDDSKERFLCSAIKGLSHLLQVCQQMQSEVLLEGILICNKKLFMSVDLSYIQRVIDRDPALKAENLYHNYVRDLSWMVLQIVKESHISTENTLLSQALEVVNKMVANLGYKDFESIEGNSQFYLKLMKQMMVHYVNSLCQPRYLFTTTRVVWLSDNKQAVNNLFQMIKKLSSYVYEDFFRAIDSAFDNYMANREHQLVVFSNLLFLISELNDRHYLERSTNMNKAKNHQILILANTVKKVSNLVQQYANNRQKYLKFKDSQYLDIAVLIFCESVLVEFLNSFESTSCIRIKQKLYMLMMFGQNYNEDIDYDDNQSETTLIQYLNIVFAYLNASNLSTDADVKMLYALEIVERVIFKLKWNMRRETFLKSDIFKRLLAFFDDYFMRAYPLPQIMTKVGKIIVSLNFDDILDEYKFRINRFISKLPSQDSFAPIFYYMMGIFEGLEQGNILKYFWSRLKKHLNLANFFSQMFKMAVESNSDRQYRDICKFCKILILNKGLRTASNAPITYQISNLILPHLVWFMSSINNSQQLNIDLLGDAILQLQEMFAGMLNGSHVNVFMLDQASKNRQGGPLGQLYISELMKMLIVLTNQLKLYPKLEQSVLNSFLSINKQILQYIYDNPSSKLATIYTVLVHSMVELTIQYVTGQLNGNKLIEDKLIKVMDGLRLYHQYVNRKQAFLHKKTMINNMREAVLNQTKETGSTLENRNQMLIYLLVSLIMTNHKNSISYLRAITKLIYHLNKKHTKDIVDSFVKVGVTGQKIKEISQILQSLRDDMEQNFVQEFKKWVQQYDLFQ